MRKFLLMAFAALGLAVTTPLAASAAPVTQGAAINLAADAMSPAIEAAWHCRPWSGWCRSRPYLYYGYHARPRPYYWDRPYWRRPYW